MQKLIIFVLNYVIIESHNKQKPPKQKILKKHTHVNCGEMKNHFYIPKHKYKLLI